MAISVSLHTRESVREFYFVLCSNPLVYPMSLHKTLSILFQDDLGAHVCWLIQWFHVSSAGKKFSLLLFPNNLLCEASSRRAGFQLPLCMNCTGSLVWFVVEGKICVSRGVGSHLRSCGGKVLRSPVPAMLHLRILVVQAEYPLCVESGKWDRHISAFKGLEVSWRSWKL